MLSGDRWTVADAYLIAMYASAVVAYDEAQSPNDREKAGRLALSIATRLRLTPQSRYDNRAAARTADRALDVVAGADDPLLGGAAWTQN
jgi:hypothetical protein